MVPDNFYQYFNNSASPSSAADNLVKDLFLSYDLKINANDDPQGTGGVPDGKTFNPKDEYN